MKVLVTGAAGFIGMYTVQAMIKQGHHVVGMDNLNDYYMMQLKYDRLVQCGIAYQQCEDGVLIQSTTYSDYRFVKLDLTDQPRLTSLFADEKFDVVINLAGQAGVRYSIENPYAYVIYNQGDWNQTLAALNSSTSEVWIGLHKDPEWKWSNGEDFMYFNWDAGWGTTSVHDCASSVSGKWRTENCFQ